MVDNENTPNITEEERRFQIELSEEENVNELQESNIEASSVNEQNNTIEDENNNLVENIENIIDENNSNEENFSDEDDDFLDSKSGEPNEIEEPEPEDNIENETEKTQKDEIDDYLISENGDSTTNNLPQNQEENIETKDYSYTENNITEDENVYKSSKTSAENAEKDAPKSKPKVLNKKFLFSVIVIAFCLCILVTFIMPTKKNDTTNQNERTPEQYSLSDYKNYAKNDPFDADESGHYYETEEDNPNSPKYKKKRETKYDENGNVIIPPVIDEKKNKYEYTGSNNTAINNTNSSTIEIPDTRNDSLQSKSIFGIKGLTSSQQRYSTDYQKTIEKNVNSTNPFSSLAIPSKEEMLNNALSTYGQFTNSNSRAYEDQNNQSNKNDFYNRGRTDANVGQGEWLDMNTIWQGTIFEAILTSELNTDLPGEITARVSKNIYSSQDGRYLLIPQNSILYGSYNSSISYSQKRVQVGWHTIVRPDGYSIYIGNMNGTDPKGASGLKGHINDHPIGYLKAIGLMSVVSIINSEFQEAMSGSTNEYVQNIMANSQEVSNQLGEKLIDRAMNVQPTIIIKSGTKLNIVANKNLTIPPMEEIPVTQKYMRNKK